MRLENSKLYKKNQKYSFTINPDNDLQFFKIKDPYERLSMCLYNTLHILKLLLQDVAIFNLQLEMSLPTQSCKCNGSRIHWHGTIEFSQPLVFLLSRYHLLQDNFIFEIDTIADEKTWKEYINKDKSLFNPLCKENDLPYEIDNATPITELWLIRKFKTKAKKLFEEIYETPSILNF